MTSSALLRARSLEIGFGSAALLPPLELAIGQGDCWAVLGPNGGGKSTLLRTLVGLLPPVRGAVERRTGLRIAYLRQRSRADELYPVVARDVVDMGTLGGALGRAPRRSRQREVQEALALMGAVALAEVPFRALSEGQRQRVLLARVAAARADLVLLDEPTSAMDAGAQDEAFALLDRLRRERGAAIVLVSHFVERAAALAEHALYLERDPPRIVVGVPADLLAGLRLGVGRGVPGDVGALP